MVYLYNSSLDIKAERVGDGQHGSARWMNQQEEQKTYRKVDFGYEKEPGIMVDQHDATWLIDTSDQNMLLLAPPGGRKTKAFMIPSVYYNAQVNKNTKGQGPSMVIMDAKGEMYRSCNPFLKECGYRTTCLNFRDIGRSDKYQLMYKINLAIDAYKATPNKGDKAYYYGMAERYAKVLASTIVDNIDSTSKSDASDYFNETAKGLMAGIILLVSEYAEEEERHIISVFNLILEMNGQDEPEDGKGRRVPEAQKTKLESLMDNIGNLRIRNYTGAATSADMRTSMNVFSSALSKLTKFIDAELEQLVCQHSAELSEHDFVEKPTAIFIICPDENTTRHFFASLFIRFFSNDLIDQAEREEKGKLKRDVIFFCDEFGNMPPIQDVDVLFSAIRSRGVRIIIALQSYSQLYKAYTREKAQIILDTCQMLMFTFTSPNSLDTAEKLSKMLGNQTVMSGSVSQGNTISTTTSMVGKPLIAPSEMPLIPPGQFIVEKAGCRPHKSNLRLFFDYLKIEIEPEEMRSQINYVEVKVASGDSLIRRLGLTDDLFLGQFDTDYPEQEAKQEREAFVYTR